MADPRAIHEFTTGQVEVTTLLLGDFVDLDAQSGYSTFKMSVSDLGEVILEDIEYTQDLTTADKTIIGAINEQQSVIGYNYDEYDATTAYSKDDLCIYNNTLYKALQATTGNLPTNATYWEQTSIADELSNRYTKSEVDTALSGKANYSTVYNQNLASITRRAETVTTGATGNIATGVDNDGYYYILCPFVSGNNYKVDCWVSSTNNIFYLTVRDLNGNTINNTSVDIRYLIMRINRAS